MKVPVPWLASASYWHHAALSESYRRISARPLDSFLSPFDYLSFAETLLLDSREQTQA